MIKKLILVLVILLSVTNIIYGEGGGYKITVTDYTRGINKVSEGDKVTTIDQQGSYTGNYQFTVTFAKACVVISKVGNNYTRLFGTKISDDSYVYTVNLSSDTEIIVALKGDFDLNGKIQAKDAAAISKKTNDKLISLIADVDSNGKLQGKDAAIASKAVTNSSVLSFDIEEWTEPQY